MASRFFALALVCALFVVSARAADEQPPYELKKNTNSELGSQEVPSIPSNQFQQQQQQGGGFQQQSQSQIQLHDHDNDNDDDDDDMSNFGSNELFPMFQNGQNGMPNQMGPLGFLGHIMNNFRNQHDHFNRQFEQLQQQATQGEEVTHFVRNGVGYTRVCKTRRDE